MQRGIRRIVNPFVPRGAHERLSRHDRTSSNQEGVREKKIGRVGKEKGNCEEEAEGREKVGGDQD